MINRSLLAAAALTATATGAARAATTTDFSFVGDLTAGYNSNPYLDEHAPGAATINLSLAPQVTFSTPTGSTVLAGTYSREQYLSNYGHSDYFSANATHKQEFSTELSGTAGASFFDSTSALLQPFLTDAPADIDLISSRQRVRSFGGTGELDWQPTSRDSFGVSADVQRTVYPGDLEQLGSYTSYGGSLSYNRVISDRTTVGGLVSVNRTLTTIYPDSTVYEPRATLRQKVNEHWTANGSVGLILEDSSFAGHSRSTTSVAFSGGLCGTYPRLNLCLNASHDAVPTGYGGTRLRWDGSVTVDYQLAEHSHLSGNAGYARDSASSGAGTAVPLPALSFIQASATYAHDLTQRLGLTVTGGYQRRRYQSFGTADALSISAGLRITLGRRR